MQIFGSKIRYNVLSRQAAEKLAPLPKQLEKIIVGSSVRFVVGKTVSPTLRSSEYIWGVVKSISGKELTITIDSQPKHSFHELRHGSKLVINESQVVDVVN